jgi:putative ABC transport system permease protein
MSYLSLVLRNILRNRRRSALTVASLAVSLCVLGVVLAVYRALFFAGDTTAGGALRLVVHNKVSLTQDLPVAYEQKISEMPGVRAVTRLRWLGGTYKDPRNQFAQFAIEPRALFEVYPELTISEAQREVFATMRTACVASKALVEKEGWKLGERIPLAGPLVPAMLELTLVGVFDDPGGSEVLYFNWDYLQESLPAADERRDLVQQYYVETGSREDVARVARQIDAQFLNSSHPTRSEPEQAFLLSFLSFLGNLKLFLAAIGGAVVFAILLVSSNMLSMSVRERTAEVGLLKTLGFSSAEILLLVAGEATLIALAGGLLGCGLAEGLCIAIGGALKGAPAYIAAIKGLGLSPLAAALTLCVSFLIGLASSLGPGLSAARIPIVDALRYSG